MGATKEHAVVKFGEEKMELKGFYINNIKNLYSLKA